MTDDLHVVVLAAGKGTRMRSSLPKVLHRAAGLPLIEWVIRAARVDAAAVDHRGARPRLRSRSASGSPTPTTSASSSRSRSSGTGHALLQTERVLAGRHGRRAAAVGRRAAGHRASLERLVAVRRERGAALVVATADLADPSGYGRVVRHEGALAAHRRRSRRHPGRARHHRDQQRHLRVLAGLALRRPARLGHQQRAGRVLPARAGRRPPPGGTGRAGRAARRPRRDPRHQHPRGAGTGRPPAAAAHQRRADVRRA